MTTAWDDLRWNDRGLLPAVVQDVNTGRVLMVAWMNQEALALTLQTGEAHFWSRSRQALWHKGEESGNVMVVADVWYDCDGDTVLVRAWPQGPACHTGNVSCFFRQITVDDLPQATRGVRGDLAAAGSPPTGWPWSPEAAEGAPSPTAGEGRP
ncbi:MAG: phosphoribosyl-AMP cyclohydrolase [Anaerolineae bacterium]|nr:phosphoribosyl-AMP cyclohydrolase [Anaerolineae bacterium]